MQLVKVIKSIGTSKEDTEFAKVQEQVRSQRQQHSGLYTT